MKPQPYAIVFSGQGTERVGMFIDILKQADRYNEFFARLEGRLGTSLYNVLRSTNLSVVTANNQILLSIFHHLTAGLVMEAIGRPPIMCLGHSFGQFSALANCGAVDFFDVADFVLTRQQIINNPQVVVTAAMKSVHGATHDNLIRLCRENELESDVAVALHNQADQIVCAVTSEGAVRLDELAASNAYVVKDVNVSRPYHTRFMVEYNRMLMPFIHALAIKPPRWPVLLNHSITPTLCPDKIRAEMAIQMVRPVYWYDSIMLASEQAELFVVIDPSNVQTKMLEKALKQADKKSQVLHIANASGINRIKNRRS